MAWSSQPHHLLHSIYTIHLSQFSNLIHHHICSPPPYHQASTAVACTGRQSSSCPQLVTCSSNLSNTSSICIITSLQSFSYIPPKAALSPAGTMASRAASPVLSGSPNSWQQSLLQSQALNLGYSAQFAQLTEKAILILFQQPVLHHPLPHEDGHQLLQLHAVHSKLCQFQ